SLLVEFILTAEGDTTRLSVVESGFGEIEREVSDELDGHDDGWQVHLERLRRHLTEQLAAPWGRREGRGGTGGRTASSASPRRVTGGLRPGFGPKARRPAVPRPRRSRRRLG